MAGVLAGGYSMALSIGKMQTATTYRVIAVLFVVTSALASLIPQSKYFGGVYVIFWILLAAIVAIVSAPTPGDRITLWLNELASLLDRRGSFKSDALAEAPKFALIRILFGLFMIERSVWIIIYLFPSDWSSPLLIATVFTSLLLAVLVMIGLFTQVALLFLILVQWQIGDIIAGTSTLGNDIGAMLAVLLIIANAGAHYSMDSLLRKQRDWLGLAIAATYYDSGLPRDNVLQIGKFLALMSYWCICIYSLMMHLGEPAWMNGSAGPLLLTNNFMSVYFERFQEFFQLGPWALMLGRYSLWAMLPWYISVLPLVVLGGIWRRYVIIWGLIFFAFSLFIVQLGWLAEFEFLFFAALFWQSAFMSPRESLQVAYDDRCNLCDRTINFIKLVDIFGRVNLRPVSKNRGWLLQKGIDPQNAMLNLYGVETNFHDRTTYGYDFYITLSRSIFLLVPTYPVLLTGKALGIGPAIYRYIADRRTKLFGVCEIPTSKPHAAIVADDVNTTDAIDRSDPVVPVAVHCIVLATLYLLLMPIPAMNWKGVPVPGGLKPSARLVQGAAHLYGITPIDVFNKTDLRMAENWFTLSYVDEDGNTDLLPVFRVDGSRLGMHRSDRVYFGHTLLFRRDKIEKQGCFFETELKMFEKFARYYAEKNSVTSGAFVYRQYRQPVPDERQIVSGNFALRETNEVCSHEFELTS